MVYDFKNLSEVESLASPTENTTVMGFEGGVPVQIPASEVGGSKVFIIDFTADDYNATDTTYGNTIKEAMLRGDRVLYYDGTYYFLVTAFYINESTTGDAYFVIYTSGSASTTGVTMIAKSYSFAITL